MAFGIPNTFGNMFAGPLGTAVGRSIPAAGALGAMVGRSIPVPGAAGRLGGYVGNMIGGAPPGAPPPPAPPAPAPGNPYQGLIDSINNQNGANQRFYDAQYQRAVAARELAKNQAINKLQGGIDDETGMENTHLAGMNAQNATDQHKFGSQMGFAGTSRGGYYTGNMTNLANRQQQGINEYAQGETNKIKNLQNSISDIQNNLPTSNLSDLLGSVGHAALGYIGSVFG